MRPRGRNRPVEPSGAPSQSVAEWLARAEALFAARGVPEVSANAEFLMADVLKIGRSQARLEGRRSLTSKQGRHFWNMAEERAKRVPLAYVLGRQPFLGFDIEVGPGALIPRPETEEVVMEAARRLQARAADPLHILEIGTGTGCVAIALAQLLPAAVIYATDISGEALALALKNAEAHHVDRRIRFLREDLFRPEASRAGWADMVISNPPYIPTGELAGLEPEVLKEPRLALDGGADGLEAVGAIIAAAPPVLKRGGLLVLEIGSGQGPSVAALMHRAGFGEAEIRRDAQGHDRIAAAKW